MTLDQQEAITTVQSLKFLSQLVANLEEVTQSQEYAGIFTIAAVHGIAYSGPLFDMRLVKEIRDFLKEHEEYLKPEG